MQLFKEVRDKILDFTLRAPDTYIISNEIPSIEPIKLLELFLGNSKIIIINYFEQIGLDELWALKHQYSKNFKLLNNVNDRESDQL